jgi:hypothetical protein
VTDTHRIRFDARIARIHEMRAFFVDRLALVRPEF